MEIAAVNPTLQGEQLKAQLSQEKEAIQGFEAAYQKALETGDKSDLEKVAKDFEVLFINMLMKSMRTTIGDSGLVEKSNQREIFESMLDEAYAERMADAGGVGIGDLIVKQLDRYVQAEKNKGFDAKG